MPPTAYRFGPFLVDSASYRVVRDGVPVPLTPKLLDLLIYLVEHAGTLVSKEELLDRLWPGANVTENALAQAVSELRQALDDDAGAPRFIKTVARRGYRFIAPIEPPGPPVPHTVTPAGNLQDTGDRNVVVLDFVNVTGDPDAAWLSTGIAETVASDLHTAGDFRVVDRRRVVEAARRTGGSLDQIAGEVGARLAVVGSFQRNRDRVRITARLLDVLNGEALADAKVDGPLDTIFALQDDVVAQFSREIGLARPRRPARTGIRETSSFDAYRAFVEGSLRLESLDVRQLPRAISDFERAVAADGQYALAFAGLAAAEFAVYESTRSENQPDEPLLQRAIAHARQAVDLNDALAEAHATLALLLVSAWKTTEAVDAARRAVALESSNWRHLFRLGHASWGEQRLRALAATLDLYPDFAFAHFQMAMVHVARGRLGEAETVLRQGAAVQDRQIKRGGRYPALGLHWLLGLVRLAQEDAEEAIAEFDREHHLAEPHRLYGREYAMHAMHGRGAALLRMGRVDDALESFQAALRLYPDHAPSHVGSALAHRVRGDDEAADAALAHAKQALAVLAHARPIEAGLVRAELLVAEGDRATGGAVLVQLLVQAPPGFAGWTLAVEPFLAEVQSSQPFIVVLERLAGRAR